MKKKRPEIRNRRYVMMFRPSFYRACLRAAKAMDMSLNELCHAALQAYTGISEDKGLPR